MLRELVTRAPHVRVVENRHNVRLNRALLQIRDIVQDCMVVLMNLDIEILSIYALVHLRKAFHAARLNLGTSDVGFGVRLLNGEEYGLRFATRLRPCPSRQPAKQHRERHSPRSAKTIRVLITCWTKRSWSAGPIFFLDQPFCPCRCSSGSGWRSSTR